MAKQTAAQWRSRIIESGELPARDYVAHPENVRRHPPKQRTVLRAFIDDIGILERVLISYRTGRLINGHMRIEEAIDVNPEQLIPYDKVDLDENEERKALLFFDAISQEATYDQFALEGLLDRVVLTDPSLESMLTELASANGLDRLAVGYDDSAGPGLRELSTKAPPTMAWVLVGLPVTRYGEIAETVEKVAGINGIVLHTTVNSGVKSER